MVALKAPWSIRTTSKRWHCSAMLLRSRRRPFSTEDLMAGFWNWQSPNEGGPGLIPRSLDAAELSEWIRSRRQKLPQTRLGRTLLGLAFVFGGVFSFLPVLGIWMLPLGLFILSVDWAFVRRRRRQVEVSLTRWWKSRQAAGV
jgi:hypothetical protein